MLQLTYHLNLEKVHVHSFVLQPELGIRYTHTHAKHSEHHRFELDTQTSIHSQQSILRQIRIRMRDIFLGEQI